MKILATGAAGMLGTSLVPTFVAAGHDVVATDIDLTNPTPWGPGLPSIDWLDVRDRSAVKAAFDGTEPDLLLHLAAETSLEASDADPDHAFLTNTVATKYLALECRNRDVPMVFISTAGVFDGLKDGAYTEFDQPNPLNTYGASKYEAEKLVSSLLDKWYIVRAGWMVGGGAGKDHKFVSRILDQVREGRTTIYAVGDKYGTPTYTYDFGRCLLDLLDSDLYGLYHMACEGDGNRYDIAAFILAQLGRTDIELVEVESEFFQDEFPSVRPRSEIMRNMALDLQGMNTMRPWPDALAEYLDNHFADLISGLRSVELAV
ncbi:MAG TPA: NAD(P)-dependent oxidoreductase [Acidimicrobiales bacterium]|nr:NAD(P)-dependent oxidoreductase [Acidimicrobiales bacterium]